MCGHPGQSQVQYKIENASSIKNRKTAKEERTGRLRADRLLSNTGSSTPGLGAEKFVFLV